MIKKTMVVILLCLSLSVLNAQNAEDFEFREGKSGSRAVVAILKYKGNAKNVVVPSVINGLPVNNVVGFANNTTLESVTISAGVERLGKSAFYGCESLETITIPEGIYDIGADAFSHCTKLKNVGLPSTITKISTRAFANCTSLESIALPNGLEKIETYAFQQCGALSSIRLPQAVKTVDRLAFLECISLKTVQLSRSAQIHAEAFQDAPVSLVYYD
jgi:hypothetical protein